MLIWNAHSRMIDALAFSPDGRTLALAGKFLACQLLDATTGRSLWARKSGSTFGLSVAFARDGSVLCRDDGISIRATDGTERRNFGRRCRALALAPDGRSAFVADGGYQDLVRRYDLGTGKARGETALEAGAINRVAVSPDGQFVAVVGRKRFHLLSAKGEAIASVAARALSSGAFALAFGPDSRTLVFSAGRTLFVWDAVAAREVARVHLESKYFMDAAFAPDGRRLITVSKEGIARVWEVPSARPEGVTATWTCERSFAWDVGPLSAVAIAPDGTRAAVAGDSGRVVVWDLEV